MSKNARPLQYGKQVTLQKLGTTLSSGTKNYFLTMDASAVIISAWIESVSTSVDVKVYTRTDEGHEVLKYTFSQFTSTSTELVTQRVDDVMGEVRLEVTCVGSAEVELKAKAVHSVSDVNIDAEIDESALVVSNPTITNTTLGAAGSESSIVLPANTKKFMLRARGKSKVQIAYTATDSGTTFWTVQPGACLLEENIDRPTTTIYVQATKASEIIEVKSWA